MQMKRNAIMIGAILIHAVIYVLMSPGETLKDQMATNLMVRL